MAVPEPNRSYRKNSLCEEIIAAHGGIIHCGLSSLPSPSLAELANEFGLDGDSGKVREIERELALRLVQRVLHRGLAYEDELMPADQAAALASRFMSQFGTDEARFFVNGTFNETGWAGLARLTSSTFDTGVLVLGPRCSGCLWVEDED